MVARIAEIEFSIFLLGVHFGAAPVAVAEGLSFVCIITV